MNDDKINLEKILKRNGYYFPNIQISIENIEENKVNINYKFDLGEKSKIKKITFLGNKVFKDKKLKSIILTEEHKFWKIISGKKYLNETLISYDKSLLKNFFLNNGYYNVQINSSFSKLIKNNEFELIFNIDAGPKIYFNTSLQKTHSIEQKILNLATDAGANDCIFFEDHIEIHTNKEEIYEVKNVLEKEISNFISTEIEWIPTNKINLDKEDKDKMIKFLEILEEDDDVQNVFTNAI